MNAGTRIGKAQYGDLFDRPHAHLVGRIGADPSAVVAAAKAEGVIRRYERRIAGATPYSFAGTVRK
jgi:hypothetical protein